MNWATTVTHGVSGHQRAATYRRVHFIGRHVLRHVSRAACPRKITYVLVTITIKIGVSSIARLTADQGAHNRWGYGAN